jgi:hypothetical protein
VNNWQIFFLAEAKNERSYGQWTFSYKKSLKLKLPEKYSLSDYIKKLIGRKTVIILFVNSRKIVIFA